MHLAAKALTSGAIIALASEVARRNAGLGALITALMWNDSGDLAQISAYDRASFWLAHPVPWLITLGLGFWPALGLACAFMIILYIGAIHLLPLFGINI